MPDLTLKIRPHPGKAPLSPTVAPADVPAYAELSATSNFTFLTGASHPDELVARAGELGCRAIAVSDTNTLAGIVRAHVAARDAGVQLVVACRLAFSDPAGLEVLVYPTDLASYGRLCRLLTAGKMRASKGQCHLSLGELLESNEGLLAAAVAPTELDDAFAGCLRELKEAFDDDRLSLAASCPYAQDDRGRLAALAELSARVGVPLLATNDVRYHLPRRRALQDVITCIRLGCTLGQAGTRLLPNAERHLKCPREMARLFAAYPRAIRRSVEIARRCEGFSLDQLRYQYPQNVCPPDLTPMQYLRRLVEHGARERYPHGLPPAVRGQIEHEMALIDELRYAPYFLTVHDIVVFARSRGILCQGRGAAANSAVCYCLGVTSVDPDRIDVLFERFVSRERNEPPDIDIDFEHERREEVLQYIYGKYGRDRAALTAEVITYRGRLAVREVGKVLGLSQDCVDRLAKAQDWWDDQPVTPHSLQQAGLQAGDATVDSLIVLANELMGFPRHLSQHVGGFVITRDRLSDLAVIENASMPDRTVIEWDKDDIDALGMLKVDCLGLGMLSCLRKGFDLIRRHHGRTLTLATIPPEDPAVYDMICQADTVGVFQIESRAQMSMLPRLRPRCFYDLVIEVAIVRPGPIVGDMVHPYLRRRQGIEPVEYPDEAVRAVLGKTLGIPLFQEQAMKLAMVAGGFTPDQADQLRRAIASKRKQGRLEQLGRQLVAGMLERGYSADFAARCLQQFRGFSQYGFPESHSASFALLVYASAWMKRHYPAAFAAALLNSQPMGFYAPAQIIRDARAHGVAVLPVDVNFSGWDCRLEHRDADHTEDTEKRAFNVARASCPCVAGASCPCTTVTPAGATDNIRHGRDARGTHGRDVRATSEDGRATPALRLGMRLVKGLRKSAAVAIEQAVASRGALKDLAALAGWSGAGQPALRQLAGADAFASMGLDRQAAIWQLQALPTEPMPLFAAPAGTDGDDPPAPHDDGLDLLPEVSLWRKVMQDYHVTGLSLRRHPVSFLRAMLQRRKVSTARQLQDPAGLPNGAWAQVAGIVLVRQRPATASGTLFFTLEDETGTANVMVSPWVLARWKKELSGRVLLCAGRIERAGQVVHLKLNRAEDITGQLNELSVQSRNFR